jgi:hypothetical protein
MFKVSVDGNRLSVALNVMKSYVKEGYIYFDNPSEMFFRGMDIAMVGIVECKLKCVCEGTPNMVCVEFGQLPSDISGDVELEVDKRIILHQGRITHKIDTLHPTSVREPGTPKVPFQMVFDLPVSELQMGLKAVVAKLDQKDTSAFVRMTWKDDQFIIEDGTQSKVDVTYDKAELGIRLDYSGTLSTGLPADYIRSLISPLGKFDKAIVALGNNMPVSIGVNGDGIGAGWFTSNRNMDV